VAARRPRDLAPGWLANLPGWHAYLLCGDGDGRGLLDRLRPGGVLPALLVGDGWELGLAVADEGEGDARCDVLRPPGALVPARRPGSAAVRLSDLFPGSPPPWSRPCALNTLNGVPGPPNTPMPATIRAPTSKTLAAAPNTLIRRRRRPDGSANTGPVSCLCARLDRRKSGGWATSESVGERARIKGTTPITALYQYISSCA
jgi:hypothetical protein